MGAHAVHQEIAMAFSRDSADFPVDPEIEKQERVNSSRASCPNIGKRTGEGRVALELLRFFSRNQARKRLSLLQTGNMQ
jgi:hypothetical protein